MAQLLKRIIRAEIPNVILQDLHIHLKRKGDSIDLIGPDVKGRPIRTLEEVCRSVPLDNLIADGSLTLWDEDGTQLSGLTAKRATNLATLNDSTGSGSSGSETFVGLTDTPTNYSGTTPLISIPIVNATGDGLSFVKLNASAIDSFSVDSFSVTESGGTYNGLSIFEKGYTVPNLGFSWTASETLAGKPIFSPVLTLDVDPDASVGSGTLTGVNLADVGSQSYQITLTSTGGDSDSATSILYWRYRSHYGFLDSATTDLNSELLIESLPQSALTSNVASSYTDTGASSQKYFWICIPISWTEITILTDLDTGFALPFVEQAQVSVTGAHGTVSNYRVYRSFNSTATTSLNLGVN